jgi:hypothetical protein
MPCRVASFICSEEKVLPTGSQMSAARCSATGSNTASLAPRSFPFTSPQTRH